MKNFQKKKNISIIVAVAENNAIGYKNQLLFHLPDDLKRFKKITSGHPVIMGRNTFLSLPNGALPNRTNIVISDIPEEEFPGCSMADSIEDALAQTNNEEETFIIGGGMIYKQFLPHASKLYITKIHHSFEADTFFPEISPEEWTEVSKETNPVSSANPFEFSYIIYERNS
jgi:dihydrofolate reductase